MHMHQYFHIHAYTITEVLQEKSIGSNRGCWVTSGQDKFKQHSKVTSEVFTIYNHLIIQY